MRAIHPATAVAAAVVALAVTFSLAAGPAGATESVTFRTLLDEMTDLGGLAEIAAPRFTCKQFSSYDRASKSPEENWFANSDRGQFLRVEESGGRKEWVMMDAAGPGAIVRIWSANPSGVLRVYIDGASTPLIETKMTDFLGGRIHGIPKPIVGERSRGWNSYLPIPYAKHCKVTSDAEDIYYHVNYRTYEKGTKVESMTRETIGRNDGAIRNVRTLLRFAAKVDAELPPFDFPSEPVTMTLSRGQSVEIGRLDGPSAVRDLWVRIEASDVDKALRETVLTIVCDDEKTVVAPVGDFFGAAPGVQPYSSLPMGVFENGEMWSRWVMPYAKSFVVSFTSHGRQDVRVGVNTMAEKRPFTDRSMHFHAKWRIEHDAKTRPMRDWRYLDAKGEGTFVGAAMSVKNPTKIWWGEGDEKIYVDGEEFPSTFGTGTEDYFGYAWCCNEPFLHAYHGQPRCDGPGNYGHTSNFRWHILDRIPFREAFRFDMELWHWRDVQVDLSVVAYWYARPGGTDATPEIRDGDLDLRQLPPYEPFRVDGAIEGETMRVVDSTAVAGPQSVEGCSNETHLWWRDSAQPGDRLVLEFDVEEAGTYRVFGRFVKAVDYGIHEISINGVASEGPIDFFNDGVVVSDEIELGRFTLREGANRLTVRVVGANEAAVRKHMFGLDYLRLQR